MSDLAVSAMYRMPPSRFIAPLDSQVKGRLRTSTSLLLFATVLLHLAAALFHGWIRRDGVLESMTRGRTKPT